MNMHFNFMEAWSARLAMTLLLFTSVYICKSQSFAYDTRSDSIDLLHHRLDLDITDFSGQTLTGKSTITFHPLVNNIDRIRLDLMAFTVDSVKFNTNNAGFTHSNDLLNIPFGTTIGTADTAILEIWYHGTPYNEPNFGGFHFLSGYAYNIGVAFQAIPHNFGRTWFPCFDNFIERATHEIYANTQLNHKAYGTGLLMGVLPLFNSQIWHWASTQPIPSYLVSIAVSDYEEVTSTYNSIGGGQIPVIIAAKAQDTADVSGSFANLHAALSIYENHYGAYAWDRVGYCLLPVAGGAMEHATNISYPVSLVNGALTYQDVVVHELSHHWWGNLVTCRTAEDMWINEGMAVYSEYIFNENFYGPAQYRALVRNNHKELIRMAHIDDAGYWPLSGVPQQHTYGVTTYTKGADIAHTLRSYLGDSIYFDGVQQLLANNMFSDMDAEEFRDELSAITNYNLDDFFDTWIFQGGWPHFSIDSFQVSGTPGNYSTMVYFKQKLVGRSNFGELVPFTIALYGAGFQRQEFAALATSEFSNAGVLNTPFLPVFATINEDEKISHAVTAETRYIKTTGTLNLPHANFGLQTATIQDSVLFRVEHHWAAPDSVEDISKELTISPQRYWTIGGIWDPNFTASGTFQYNGRTIANGYLDHLLITSTEDSLVLLYRPNTATDWEIFTTAIHNTGGSLTDKLGNFVVDPLLPGEYTFAYKGTVTGIEEPDNGQGKLKIFPNPTKDAWIVNTPETATAYSLYHIDGKLLDTRVLNGVHNFNISANGLSIGQYVLVVELESGKKITGKALLE